MKCLKLFVIFPLLLLASCKDHAPPKGELCKGTGFQGGELACHNSALGDDSESYFRQMVKGDVVTNNAQYERVFTYASEMRKELIKCEKRKK